jgi:hypothetical protein
MCDGSSISLQTIVFFRSIEQPRAGVAPALILRRVYDARRGISPDVRDLFSALA